MTATTQALTLDVRTIPPHERHPRVFGAFDALAVGEAMDLLVDHEPRPLFMQYRATRPSQFDWSTLAAGPDVWHVRIHRLHAAPAPAAKASGCCGACGGQ